MRGLLCDRQQSILPGRFQPSTFDAWELNCCVRDGNRWGLPAIVTGFWMVFSVFCFVSLRLARSIYASIISRRSPGLPCIRPENPHPSASGPFRPSIPYRRNYFQKTNSPCLICLTSLSNQALDGLVPVRSIHCCTYTPGLSTLSSPRRLTDLCHERSHLGVGFTLRCFQRLSSPDVATQRYAWRHNWYTIGPSTPVLSY